MTARYVRNWNPEFIMENRVPTQLVAPHFCRIYGYRIYGPFGAYTTFIPALGIACSHPSVTTHTFRENMADWDEPERWMEYTTLEYESDRLAGQSFRDAIARHGTSAIRTGVLPIPKDAPAVEFAFSFTVKAP